MEIRQLPTNKNLEVVYESRDVVVMLAPHEDKLTDMILTIIKKSKTGITIKEIHSELRTIASEEKIRKIVNTLKNSRIIYSSKGKYFAMTSIDQPGSP
ncbi:MAG: hypothetical protein ACP5I2_03735 [Fervidicoccaceae archaeon]